MSQGGGRGGVRGRQRQARPTQHCSRGAGGDAQSEVESHYVAPHDVGLAATSPVSGVIAAMVDRVTRAAAEFGPVPYIRKRSHSRLRAHGYRDKEPAC